MEHKTLPFDVKDVNAQGRSFEGYAAAFGNIDRTDDVIHPGAFAKTIVERGSKIKLLWQHATDEPIGRPLELREDGRGLFFRGLISDTARGRDALALLKDRALFEMSIGYEVPLGGSDYSKGADGKLIRNLREIKLWEVSLVTFPANEGAVVTAVKAMSPRQAMAALASLEAKAGRMISDANARRLRSAMTELRAILEAAGLMDDMEGMDGKSRAQLDDLRRAEIDLAILELELLGRPSDPLAELAAEVDQLVAIDRSCRALARLAS